MKQYIALLLAILICISFSGCENKAIAEAQTLIAAIGEVTLDSDPAISAAEEALRSLSVIDQEKVENAQLLAQARKAYQALLEEQAMQERDALVQAVEDAIDAIGKVDRNSEPAIAAAEEALAQLREDFQPLVSNSEALANARAAYEAIFVPVEITLDNWQEYFETDVVDIWHEDENGNPRIFEQRYILRVKEAYQGNILVESMDLSIEFSIPRYRSVWHIDWDNRTYEIGDLQAHKFGTGTPIDTITYSWNKHKEIWDWENFILCSYENAYENREWGEPDYRLCGTEILVSYIAGTMTIIQD